jgi:hypothetical protein
MQLFENISDRTILKLKKTKTLCGGTVILYYEQIDKKLNPYFAVGLSCKTHWQV